MQAENQPHRVPPDPRGAGVYATITRVARRVSVTVIAQDERGDMRLMAHETVDDDAAALSVVVACAAVAGVPGDRVHIADLGGCVAT
jgi:hypothetical protein